jgi:hypothetical protein
MLTSQVGHRLSRECSHIFPVVHRANAQIAGVSQFPSDLSDDSFSPGLSSPTIAARLQKPVLGTTTRAGVYSTLQPAGLSSSPLSLDCS